MTTWGIYRRALRDDDSRHRFWKMAFHLWRHVGGSAKYLAGTHRDRQTGAVRAHRWRQEFGQQHRAHADKSGLHVVDSDEESRLSSFRGEHSLRRDLLPVAQRVREGKYHPRRLREARWPKDPHTPRRGWRVVEIPTVTDRLACSVLLEILEPLLDPVLSDHQHGYRASRVLGRYRGVPDEFPGIPRGSTDIVAHRLARHLAQGWSCVWEIDVVNAFPSVSRKRLRQILIEDGCPKAFSRDIIAALGRHVFDGKDTRPTTGIPLGNPVGPLLFNFFLRGVHADATEGIVTVSYADNIYGVARDYDSMVREMTRTVEHLHALGLAARGMGVDLTHADPWAWRVLGSLRLSREPSGDVGVRGVESGRPLGEGEFVLDPRRYRPRGGLRTWVLEEDDLLREEGVVR